MKLQTQTALPLIPALVELLTAEIDKANPGADDGLVLNFRDPDYSAEGGGYHPVEIALDSEGHLLYVTDFAYVGSGWCVELAKELDFDFSLGVFQQMGRDYPLQTGRELFGIWQQNFCAYYQSGVFEVSCSEL